MDLKYLCGVGLDAYLWEQYRGMELGADQKKKALQDVTNKKIEIFNFSTAILIAAPLLALLKIFYVSRPLIILMAVAYGARVAADNSMFKCAEPTQAPGQQIKGWWHALQSKCTQAVGAGERPKHRVMLSVGETVLFYEPQKTRQE